MDAKKQKLMPGDFKESRDRFTRLRQQKPSKEKVLSILEKGTGKANKNSNKKTARNRDIEV